MSPLIIMATQGYPLYLYPLVKLALELKPKPKSLAIGPEAR